MYIKDILKPRPGRQPYLTNVRYFSPDPYIFQSDREINLVCPGKHICHYFQDRVGNLHNTINCDVGYTAELRYPHVRLLIS